MDALDSGHSLPTVEAMQGSSGRHISTRSEDHDERSKKQKRLLVFSCIGIATLVSVIIGLAIGLAQNNNNKGLIASTQEPMVPSNAPTPIPTPIPAPLSREDLVVEYLSTFSDSEDLKTIGSPQQRAAKWMAEIDEMQYDVPKEGQNGFKFVQRYSLTTFFMGLSGDSSTLKQIFLQSYDECNWGFETFETTNFRFGVTCDSETGKVSEFRCPQANLKGDVPPEVGLLTGLTTVWLMNNYIESLPDSMQDLTSLDSLVLTANSLKKIPAWIGKLTNLSQLWMQENLMTEGPIPAGIGLLTNLEHLSLDHANRLNRINGLSGELPTSMGELTKLTYLALEYNALSGPFPTWFDQLSNLRVLSLSNNDFRGKLPDSLGTMTSLSSLYLDDNDFTGSISMLNNLTNLNALLIEDNSFEGTIDEMFLAECDNLMVLDISDNAFVGNFPFHLLEKKKLTILDIHDNMLGQNQPLPDKFPMNTALNFLTLHDNSFFGSLPPSISNMTGLTHLDLSLNNFDGVIATDLGVLTDLTFLSLGDNNFDNGLFPEFIRNLTNLRELSLTNAERRGSVPVWIGELSELILLNLYDNEFSSTVPDSIGDLTNLQFLLLNSNDFQGLLPALELKSLSKLQLLLINNNNITGAAEGLCNGQNPAGSLSFFNSDCGGAPDPQFDCPCCTLCCDSSSTCNNNVFLNSYEPIWENNYKRDAYYFGSDDNKIYGFVPLT